MFDSHQQRRCVYSTSAWALLLTCGFSLLGISCSSADHHCHLPNQPDVELPGQPAMTPEIRDVTQERILAHQISLHRVLDTGAHLFTTNFTEADGFGEGQLGPRAQQRAFLYPTLNGPMDPNATLDNQSPSKNLYPFLRLNGLDSQSCFECHNSIGSDREPGARLQTALFRKPGEVGGAAGVASSAYINPDFPRDLRVQQNPTKPMPACPMNPDKPEKDSASPIAATTQPCTQPTTQPCPPPTIFLTKFVRNAPHTFGSGYTQQLAIEMTIELMCEREMVRTMATAAPGQPRSVPLVAKSIDFGTFATTYDQATHTFSDDYSGVVGLAESFVPPEDPIDGKIPKAFPASDLMVRPFQWKGIAANLRHFERDALDFHFSLTPEEKFGPMDDNDGDGKTSEISIGNVTALVAFTGMLRPPIEVTEPGKGAQVALGGAIFRGATGPNDEQNYPGLRARLSAGGNMCATCHVPSLRLDNPTFMVPPPDRIPSNPPATQPTTNPAEAAPRFNRNADIFTIPRRISRNPTGQQNQQQPALPPAALPPGAGAEPVGETGRMPSLVNSVPHGNMQIYQFCLRAAQQSAANAASLPQGAGAKARPRAILEQARQLLNTPEKIQALWRETYRMLNDLYGPPQLPAPPPDAFLIDLTPKPGHGLPRYLFPRLEKESDGHVDVPLFSDLKLHRMGTKLQDTAAQPTDAQCTFSPRDAFLTRPLWGVADTGPWLHDGRATTLQQAILDHGDDESGGEAVTVTNIFRNLNTSEQEAVVQFLLTLRLPRKVCETADH